MRNTVSSCGSASPVTGRTCEMSPSTAYTNPSFTVAGGGAGNASDAAVVCAVGAGERSAGSDCAPAACVVTTKVAAGELAVGRARQRNIGGWMPPNKRGNKPQ